MAEWYEASFGSDYMVVYRHRDWKQAGQEISQMANWLALPAEAAVLDIGCGTGRHALALADCGYAMTGLDLSPVLLEQARLRDAERRVNWVLGDMRRLPFADASFQAAVNLFTSFGYFSQEQDNVAVLREVARVLIPRGAFLVDFLNPEAVKRELVPFSKRIDEETGWTIEERRTIEARWVKKEIAIMEPGQPQRHYTECVRLYSLAWFREQLEAAGLELEQVYGDYEGSSYDEQQSPRMIMAGRARA